MIHAPGRSRAPPALAKCTNESYPAHSPDVPLASLTATISKIAGNARWGISGKRPLANVRRSLTQRGASCGRGANVRGETQTQKFAADPSASA
jgi:hypothetical protein